MTGSEPAFPVFAKQSEYKDGRMWIVVTEGGLSKRELFAAMAMQGLCASEPMTPLELGTVVSDAAKLADLLIAELAKEQK